MYTTRTSYVGKQSQRGRIGNYSHTIQMVFHSCDCHRHLKHKVKANIYGMMLRIFLAINNSGTITFIRMLRIKCCTRLKETVNLNRYTVLVLTADANQS